MLLFNLREYQPINRFSSGETLQIGIKFVPLRYLHVQAIYIITVGYNIEMDKVFSKKLVLSLLKRIPALAMPNGNPYRALYLRTEYPTTNVSCLAQLIN
jgi:hypothetical protein